ncbi:MAG: anthranilate synthase component I family protein [Acidobacteriota bacterium]|nr:MAG: anthranilate synthase component I family protein [Acidobacteriota bacterium]
MIFHKSVLADLLTPVSAYMRVSADSDRAFLLESVEGGERVARYSFIGVDPYRSFEGTLEEFRQIFPQLQPPHPDLPPFAGGAVGVFAYDMVRELERIPHEGTEPPRSAVRMDLYSTVLAFDHVKHQIIIMSHDSAEKVDEIEQRLRQVSSSESRVLSTEKVAAIKSDSSRRNLLDSGRVARSSFSRDEFCDAVEKAKEYIRAGDIFQVVLSQRFEEDFRGDPFSVYRALRYINPSPYMFFLKQGETCVAGSSPEMLVRVEGRELEYRPIAGTRRRGRDAEHERRLEVELLNDEKEKAEHLMLVDLGRNDLGRVSDFGEVRVENLMFLEKYSHVMHMVSALKGRLREDRDRFDALAACFPAGTVTGAPKIRAMEIIQELERSNRGIYAGAIGYIDYSGNLDSCIAIRTIVFENGKAQIQAGAGIVADSVPELENLECHNKAQVLFKALELGREL